MKKTKTGIIAVLLIMLVGFAAISTSIVLNGTAVFGTNTDDFDVIFTKSVVDGIDVSDISISEDGKSIMFSTGYLAVKDDTSVLNFTVTNNSTQYDAKVIMECTADGEYATDYYTITSTIPEVVEAKRSVDGSVTATLTKSSVDEIMETFTCTISAIAQERDTVGDSGLVAFIPTYFEYGKPTILSSTDYTTLGYNIFAGLGTDGSLGVCINDGKLFCIKTNDFENSVARMKEYYGEDTCVWDESMCNCFSDSFNCYVESNGLVDCTDNNGYHLCNIDSDGNVDCHQYAFP